MYYLVNETEKKILKQGDYNACLEFLNKFILNNTANIEATVIHENATYSIVDLEGLKRLRIAATD